VSRRYVVATVVSVCVLSGAAFASASWASRPPADVTALAVIREHVDYESGLIDQAMSRLTPSDSRSAAAVLALTSALDGELTRQLQEHGYSPARAHAVWQKAIGDGAPAPSRVLLYVCSIHSTQSERVQLAAATPDALGPLLGDIELTLLVEGRQLARSLGAGSLSAAADRNQRDALHVLAPLLIPTDRGFATAA
jgi:hypothetical protein